MDIRLFNRVGKGRKGRLNSPKVIDGPRDTIDSFGLLDAGFEDFNAPVQDYAVAPGLVGHFGLSTERSPGYYSLPPLEVRLERPVHE